MSARRLLQKVKTCRGTVMNEFARLCEGLPVQSQDKPATLKARTEAGEGGAGRIRTNQQEGMAGSRWKRLIVLPLCVCLLTSCSARKPVLSVSVSDTERLRDLLNRKRIDASLADGAQVEGRVREVQDGLLTVDVKESSGPSSTGAGLHSIPTDRISTVRFTRRKGYRRALFGTLFFLGGWGLGLAIAQETNEVKPAYGVIGGMTAFGYFLGRQKDKQNVTVEIQQADASGVP